MPEWLPSKFNITVSGNTGSVTRNFFGSIRSLSIVPPSAGIYDLEMYDADGHYFVAEDDISGTNKIKIDDTLVGSYTILISNAPNGVYKLRVSWRDL
jgi:hypothetical protein